MAQGKKGRDGGDEEQQQRENGQEQNSVTYIHV